jgi:tetratricopeptide (TPR) repeat protein
VYLRLKEYRNAEQAAQNETSFGKGAVWNSLLLSLDRGRATGLKESFDQILRRGPNATRGSRNELRSYEYFLGTLELRQKQMDQAILHFKDALHHLPPSSGMDLYEDCLGNAYLEAGRLEEALDEYQRILRLNPNYPLAQYHLGQAYQREGHAADARTAYERFLQIWKNADANIPEVVEAKRELTLLKSGT